MVVPSALVNVFNGGQMTDLPEYTGGFDGTALFEIVSPGNQELGVNYTITMELLLNLIIGGLTSLTIITVGATLADPYEALGTDYRVLLNKIIASPSYVEIGSGADRDTPIMVRDLKGDASTNNITVTFTGTCDGLASPIVISNPYGGWYFNPLPDGNWYLTNT